MGFGNAVFAAAITAAAVVTPAYAQAVTLPVGEASFENPVLGSGVQGWPFSAVPFGGPGVPAYPNYPWIGEVLDAGLFYNPEPTQPGQDPTGYLDNMDGHQAAFIGGAVGNEFYQEVPATYEAGNSYTLRFGLAKSLFSPPKSSASSTANVVAGLYYLDNSDDRHLIASQSFFDDAATGLRNDHFKYVEFSTPLLAAGNPAVGQPVFIVFSMGGTLGGHFDIDNVSVTAIPEPSAVAFIALAAMVCARRRK